MISPSNISSNHSQEEPFILCQDLFKIYKRADLEVVALRGLDLSVQKGEIIAIIGPSGSGKSTLLNVLAGLDKPSAGKVTVGGRDLLTMKQKDLVEYRRVEVGFIEQNANRNLLPYLTVIQNVEMPQVISGRGAWERRQRAAELLKAVDLADRANFTIEKLSGGEQQRTAIAVALANMPALLLADEPTGELDTRMAKEVYKIFQSINQMFGTTVIIVSHYPRIAEEVDRVVAIRDGRTSTETVMVPTFKPTSMEASAASSEEYVVMDQAGRLQIPPDLVQQLKLGGRVRVRMENGRLVVLPSRENSKS